VTRRDLLLASGAVLMAAMLSGCSRALPTYRYRLTVEVDTPQGLRSGSSVIEVRTFDQGSGFPGPEAGGLRMGAIGEAVAVDLPSGKTLFVLLRSESKYDGASGYAIAAYSETLKRKPGPLSKDVQWVDWLREIKRQTTPAVVPRFLMVSGRRQDVYPVMVTFRNSRDPRTVVPVDPDNLSDAFGRGVSLKRIVAQITDDPVTVGIRRKLPRYGQLYREFYQSLPSDDARQVPVDDFIRREK